MPPSDGFTMNENSGKVVMLDSDHTCIALPLKTLSPTIQWKWPYVSKICRKEIEKKPILKPLVEDSSLQLNWAQSDFTIILFDVLEEVIEDWVGEPHGKVVVAVGHGWEAE